MESDTNDICPSKWPVIINASLGDTELLKLLGEHKLRVSSSTLADTVIFPMSAVTFMVFYANGSGSRQFSKYPTSLLKELQNRISKMLEQHRNCYLICLANLQNDKELQLFDDIQNKFLFTSLHMLPVQNHQEAVQCMLNIAKAMYKPVSAKLLARLEGLVSGPWCETQRISALRTIGLSENECKALLDAQGSLQCIANADQQTLLRCGLDKESCQKVLEFFNGRKE